MLEKIIYSPDDGTVVLYLYFFGFLVYRKRVQVPAIVLGYTPQVR